MDRSWGVAGAASLTAFFAVVMMMNSGFFYVALIEEFGVTRESASWPMSVMSIVSHSSGLLISCLQRHLTVFQIGLIGSIFLWAGILGAVFAPNIAWVTVTLGAIHGMGMGVVCVTLIVVVMMYFDKYRGVASGLKFAGYTLASLLFPKILTSLRDAYGFRGTLLVYAALTMNVTALTLLLKEPPWQLKGHKSDTNASAPDGRRISWISPTSSHNAASAPVRGPDSVNSEGVGSENNCVKTGNTHTPYAVGVTHNASKWTKRSEAPATRCSSGNEYPAKNRKTANPVRTWLLGFKHSGGQATANHVVTTETRNNERRSESANQVARSTEMEECTMHKRHNPHSLFGEIGNLLSKPRFYVCVLAVVAIDYTVAIFPATIVDYALDKGASRSHADLSVTYCSPAELFGRIVLPLIGDSKMVSRTALVSASFFLLAVTMLALPPSPSFLAYILVCACMTMLIGCLISMKPVVIADYFGIESVPTSWGFAGVTLIPLLFCSPYIIGYFRDTRGSYDGLYQLQAGIHCLVGGLFGLLAILDRRRRKQWTTNQTD